YLQLRLGLVGNGRGTPALRALRAYYPRFSYRDQYLPAAYRDNEQSASFVDRFLANFEGVFTGIEDRIATAQVLLDAQSVPAEALDWLASWFGIVTDPNWDARRKRLLVTHAMHFFQQRGTPRGVEMALRLAMDQVPDASIFDERCTGATGIRVIEEFRTRDFSRVDLGDPGGLPGQDVRPTGVDASDSGAWQAFLARRYIRIDALNAAHGRIGKTALKAFDDVQLPTARLRNRTARDDWSEFVRIIVPTRRRAHRFTVLLPLAQDAPLSPEQRSMQLALAQRLLDLEKPAHTVASVAFYWAIFRLGEVRLGQDTQLKSGSRAPELAPAVVLQQAALAEAFLHAANPTQRTLQ
ncbi:MAG TPA: phage tail protein, partial [Chloroflexota bacterium]|nr:phage tail protein [Chloroflexota bacterium]